MASIPRSLSALQYVSSESSTRTSVDDFGNLAAYSSVEQAKIKKNPPNVQEKCQHEMLATPCIPPGSSLNGQNFSSDFLSKNTSFSSFDNQSYFDQPSGMGFHKEFHSSEQSIRHNTYAQGISLSSAPQDPGVSSGFKPNVELPLMASFPQNESSFIKVSDRNHARGTFECEPSSFLRMRVQNLQQRLPMRGNPEVGTKYTTPLCSRSENSAYFPFREKKENPSTFNPQYQVSETSNPNTLIHSDQFAPTNMINKNSNLCEPGRPVPQTDARSKLSAIQDKIVRFEGQLQVESQQKKAAEENKLQVLRESISTVEKTLNAEVRRRLETIKSLHASFENQLQTFHTHVERSVAEKQRQITEGVESIASRLHAAERRVDALHDSQNATVQKLTEDIEQATVHIRTLKEHLDNELKARRQREAILLDRLMDVEKQLESRIALERGIREKDVLQLKCSLDSIHDNHIALDDAFQQSLANTFHELKTSLQQEAQAREQADDDIVQALNHYTAALQGALSIANSS